MIISYAISVEGYILAVLPEYLQTSDLYYLVYAALMTVIILVAYAIDINYRRNNLLKENNNQSNEANNIDQQLEMLKIKETTLAKKADNLEKLIKSNKVLIHDIKSPIIAQIEALKISKQFPRI